MAPMALCLPGPQKMTITRYLPPNKMDQHRRFANFDALSECQDRYGLSTTVPSKVTTFVQPQHKRLEKVHHL